MARGYVLFAALCAVTVHCQPFPDWLVTPFTVQTELLSVGSGRYRLTNGLISRDFVTSPDFATVDFYSYERKQSLLRAISSETVVEIDGLYYNVGGLLTDMPRGYLNRTALAENATFDPNAFHFVSYSTAKPEAPFQYQPRRGAPDDIVWPPCGLRLDVKFHAPFWAPHYHQMVTVVVHWEMYDGIPLMAKWVSISGLPQVQDKLDVFVSSVEYLALNWQWATVGYGWLHVENDVPHTTVQWTLDPTGLLAGGYQPVVNCTYPHFGHVLLSDGFESFRVHELVVGSSDRERFNLAVKRKMRLLAPHTQENPIFFHMISQNSTLFHDLVDQAADVGFEMIIYSFGSGFNMESDNKTYLEQVKSEIAYANSKGIEVGGYDLIVLTRNNVPEYWRDIGGDGTCIASSWYEHLMEHFLHLVNYTGLSMVETDGPYPGYSCASTNHSHHHDVNDSVYWQLKFQSQMYRVLRDLGVYINQPDDYFYQGGSKTGMGYDESQYSLPRWLDLSVSRQGMYDDLYRYIPTVGWMFLPLTQYHGGGDAATFEPLSDHLVEYEYGLAQYFGAGVAACYRGWRLYDSEKTRDVVAKWVSFFKKYRRILTSDVVHIRRPDMQGIDAFLHVNPALQEKGLMMVFNPTLEHIADILTVPLYYTGLTSTAQVSHQGDTSTPYSLDREYNVYIPVDLTPLNITWFIFR